MHAPSDIGTLNFTLQKLALPPAIGARAQAGAVDLVVMPCRPQPVIDRELVSIMAGIAPGDDVALIQAIQSALIGGMIATPVCLGYAFELGQALPAQKYARLGTALVRHISITRAEQLTEAQLRQSGHSTADDFAEYWASAVPDIPAATNPWCWLIRFELKG